MKLSVTRLFQNYIVVYWPSLQAEDWLVEVVPQHSKKISLELRRVRFFTSEKNRMEISIVQDKAGSNLMGIICMKDEKLVHAITSESFSLEKLRIIKSKGLNGVLR